MRSTLDHLVVVAPDLESGARFVEQALGVPTLPGGEHARMGTHNRLLRLGERVYLEVIAIQPSAPPPGRPRWFGMDTPGPVRLATWVARTDDIEAAAKVAPASPGAVEPMSRGNLDWRITIPWDGKLSLGGLAPALIQWPDGVHPADAMPDSGCSLVRLEGLHPHPDAVERQLRAIRFDGQLLVMQAAKARLIAHIQTPGGLRQLTS